MIDTLNKQLFGFDDPDTRGERTFRTLLELFIVLSTIYLAWKWGIYTLRNVDVVLPLAFARLFDVSFMFGNSLPFINAALITVAAGIGYTKVSRWGYTVALVLLILQYSVRFSQGEIPHSANLIGMGLMGFAIGSIVYTDPVHRSKFGAGFNFFFLGFAYFSAGISKLIASGLAWPDGKHLWMWINEKAVDEIARTGVLELTWIQELALDSWLVATLFLVFGLVTELLAFLIWYKRTRLLIVWAVFAMHIGIYLAMDIVFILSMYELILLGVPLAYLIDRRDQARLVAQAA